MTPTTQSPSHPRAGTRHLRIVAATPAAAAHLPARAEDTARVRAPKTDLRALKPDPGAVSVSGAPPSEDLATVLADGHRALVDEGDLNAGRRHFDRAYRIARREGDAGAAAAAALGLTGLWVHEQRDSVRPALAQARLKHALSLTEPGSPLALRLRARLAGEADYRSGRHAAILAVLDQARASGDPVALAETLSIAHHCVLGPEHGELRRALAEELVAESFHTGRRSDLLMGLLWQTVDLLLAGDPHALRSLNDLRGLLAREGHLAVGFVVSAIDVMLALRAGDLARAETLAQACAAAGEAAGDIDAEVWYLGQLVAIRWYQGRLPELLPLLDDLVDCSTLSILDYSCLAARAVAAAVCGDRRKAAASLAILRGRGLAELPRSSSWLVTMHGVVEAAHLLNDTDTAQQAYDLLAGYADLPMVGGLGVACFGSVQHALGVAALTVGDHARAAMHLAEAVRRNTALGHWPAVIASRLALARALTGRAGAGDAAAARLAWTAAVGEAAALGLATPAADAPQARPALPALVREGRHWRLSLGPRTASVEHNVGMLHLAVLIANPGQEIPALDLAAGLAAVSRAGGGRGSSNQQVLDAAAVREYRLRVTRLRIEIEQLQARNQPERAARATVERDWLLAELARAAGIAGRQRRFPDDMERARIAVGKAIRRALDRIAEADPLIGAQLRGSVHTGLRCSYRPL
ncbi:MAG TPA: hypothetical protein VGX23_05650 [Actinocrinis sp.]|nr:hypothetical protein [Actinocrinis sp.]